MSLRALTWAFDLAEPKLTSTQKLVLITLANYANDKYETYPKQNTIAAKVGLTRPTVCSTLSDLAELGLITIIHRFHDNGGKRSSVYRLHVSAPPEPGINDDDDGPMSNNPTGGMSNAPTSPVGEDDKVCQGPRRGMSSTETSDVADDDMNNRILEPSLEPKQEPNPEPKKRRKTAPWPADFREQFWALYPKRKNTSRKAAWTRLEGLEREDRVEFSDVMAGLRIYAERMNAKVKQDRKNEQFIAHAITWINQERWETEEADQRETPEERHRRMLSRRSVAI
jgi:hypothetical protein